MLPFIFILDWDGTIAGKVDYQSHAYSLVQSLKRSGQKPSPGYNPNAAFSPTSKLIRPGFAGFIAALRAHYGPENVMFFIYTASERQWAHYEINIMEREHGIQFMRPIFTRDDCIMDNHGNYRKSIARIFPRVCRAAARQRPFTKNEKAYILQHQLMIIDNNAVYSDYQDKVLLCPDYDYCVFENLLDILPKKWKTLPGVWNVVRNLAQLGVVCPSACGAAAAQAAPAAPAHGPDYMQSLTESYTWIAVKCRQLMEENKTASHDDFFRYLKKIIIQNDIRNYSKHTVKQLQDIIWKKYNASASKGSASPTPRIRPTAAA